MSVDPAAAAAANASGAAALDALVTAELNALAADAQALQAQVAIGDILNATVLPSNGLSDLINIAGSRVAASLPPTLTPGDQITVQVTGFNGPQILLQILSAGDGEPGTANVPGTPIPIPAEGSAPATPASVPSPAGTVPPPSASPLPPGGTPVAPPAAAFVAASVRPNAPVPPPIVPGVSAAEPVDGPPGTIPGAAGTTLIAPVFDGIEARLAASRAAATSLSTAAPGAGAPPSPAATAGAAPRPAPNPPAPPPPAPAGNVPAAAARGAGAAPANLASPLARPFVVPPQIVASRFAAAPAAAPAAPANGAASGAAAAPAPPAGVAHYQDPLALVRALKLPVTPTNLAAAKLALDAPQRLPAALATLESALPQSDDPRVATLRTIAAFVGKLEPGSPQLATQIAAYVDHVVTGSEPVLAQLLAAHVAETALPESAVAPPADGLPAGAPVEGEPATAPAGAATPAATESAPAAVAAESTVPVVALAQIAERAATIAVSLKEQLFSLVNGPPAGGRDAESILPSAASAALTAVTSVQMAAVAAAAANPQTMSFSLPMWLGSSYAQAQIAVDRDAPDTPNVPLDGDNFHIAFVLDTKHLGTVAIDLRTVGRSFALSVKTENLRTAQRFGDELSRLTDRLSSLRYQPKSVEAMVATSGPMPEETGLTVAVATDAPAAAAAAGEFNERA
jgi:hypothetical protein